MTRDEARQHIRENPSEHLQPDNSGKGYVCPICGSGTGRKGTGLTTKDGVHFTCWRGCFSNADVIDIIGLESGITDYGEKIACAASIYGVSITDEPSAEYQNHTKNEQHTQHNIHNTSYTTQHTQPEQPEDDYTDFFLEAAKHIAETDYHRGLSEGTLHRFKLGYVAEWKNPKAPNAPASPRLIIPTSRQSYLARDTRSELDGKARAYSKTKVGKSCLFNVRALQEATSPIFVVEGELDALSIIDVGGEAIALGGTSNVKQLIALCERERPAQPFVLSLDNDEAGKRAQEGLKNGLERIDIVCYEMDVACGHKDANEALCIDREALRERVQKAERIEAETIEAEREALQSEAAAYCLQDFIGNIEKSKTASFVSTGFPSLDAVLDGGLYAGLYVVGAISSLGKTTFCLQIADQIAQGGTDVLIFSLEMARDELIAKSVSRLSLIRDLAENGTTANAKTTRGILTGSRYAGYSQKEKDLIRAAVEEYSGYAAHIYITQGLGDVGVSAIREKVANHKRVTGRAPAVLIDYIQILAPSDPRATDKQNTDKAVLELKRISRDYGIPVIGISSFNRDNYSAPVNLASFKESGAIEYSSDVLIGLQYEGMDYRAGENDKARDKRLRELMPRMIEEGRSGRSQPIQIKVLKNRNGSKGSARLDFYPMFNYFTEAVIDDDADEWNVVASTADA